MKIALITTDVRGKSGWSRYAADLGRALKNEGHTITAIVHQKADADFCTEEAILGRDVDELGNPLRRFADAWKLSRALKRIKPDIVHYMAEPYGLLLPFIHGPWKSCVTIHGSYAVLPLAKGGAARKLAIKMYKEADRIFSVSNFTKNHLIKREPSLAREANLEQKIVVLRNGIDLSRVPPLAEGRKLQQPRTILGVGAVKERKGYIQAVEACAAFQKTFNVKIQYDICGSLEQDPAYVAKLRQRITELGMDDAVNLLGSVGENELEQAYWDADLFLLLSQSTDTNIEGFGLVFLEAAARGIPSIGPTSGGCPEAIRENRSGYSVDAGNPKLVAERMHQILVQQSIRREECRIWAEINSVDKRARELVKAYEELMA